MTEQSYPGLEGFWRTSPELVEMQSDLKKLWGGLDESPALEEEQILDLPQGSVVAVKRIGGPFNSYRIFELGSPPTVVEGFPKRTVLLRPRESAIDTDAQAMVDLFQWSSGFNINSTPVDDQHDWKEFFQGGGNAVKKLEDHLYHEVIRQAGLKIYKRDKRLEELEERGGKELEEYEERQAHGRRILEIVKKSTGEV